MKPADWEDVPGPIAATDERICSIGWIRGGGGGAATGPGGGCLLAHLVSDLLVHDLLPAAHGALDDVLGLAGQLLLHLTLGPPQHEWPQHLQQCSL